jgi:hypothetical protein
VFRVFGSFGVDAFFDAVRYFKILTIQETFFLEFFGYMCQDVLAEKGFESCCVGAISSFYSFA